MKISKSDLFLWLAGIIIGNFAYQYFNDKLWDVAIERSYFGIAPVLALLFVSWVWKFFGKGNETEL